MWNQTAHGTRELAAFGGPYRGKFVRTKFEQFERFEVTLNWVDDPIDPKWFSVFLSKIGNVRNFGNANPNKGTKRQKNLGILSPIFILEVLRSRLSSSAYRPKIHKPAIAILYIRHQLSANRWCLEIFGGDTHHFNIGFAEQLQLVHCYSSSSDSPRIGHWGSYIFYWIQTI